MGEFLMSIFTRPTEINVRRDELRHAIEVVPIVEHADGTVSFGYPSDGEWTAETVELGAVIPNELLRKFLKMPDSWGKSLLDSLLAIYGHPEKEATAQALDATKYHLEDMRKLVFEKRVK